MFQKEYMNSQYLSTTHFIESVEEGGFMVECKVFKPPFGMRKTVRAYPADGTINCSCNKFERDRILCCHALAVLDRLFK
ncbi:hypothetical protein LIER_02754 [Lithospermum erythrorhizon]|uniref:SWIM-type domain-containing protein n=1 Tax=Lithospermum erythrorhizon TaxID=34254 RepID=A0AAV3NQK3_LITER